MINETHSTDSEILEVVDIRDRVLGLTTRGEIHAKGLLHRAVHIFVFNDSSHVFVQRRSASKDRHPLKLDSSSAGHVDPGESYATAATRELEEELGLKSPIREALKVPACKETDWEHVTLFVALTDSQPILNPEEVAWGRFMDKETLSILMAEQPHDFVPAFILLWREFLRGSE